MNLKTILSFVAVAAICAANPVVAEDISPQHRTFGTEKWRIAYYEGGEYKDYHQTLVAVIEGLMSLGWMAEQEIPKFQGGDNASMWNWLSKPGRSQYLEFVPDGFYTAGWDEDRRLAVRRSLIERLNTAEDIDLVFAMGTWAGKDLANHLHATPTMVLSASDAVNAGIVKSAEDSGFAHVHAHVNPWRFARQVEFFHDVVGFERLGIAYEDTVEGRSYSGINLVEHVAARLGFDIVRCHTRSDVPEREIANSSVIACIESLVRESDAIYVTAQGGINDVTIPEIVRLAGTHRIPTFSQIGAEEVRKGVLLSLSAGDFSAVGLFHARVIAQVFSGERPGDLKQVFEGKPRIALNVSTAAQIGFFPSAETLASTDELFGNIGPTNSY